MERAASRFDPAFATWYAAHVMQAYGAQMTPELEAVRRERMMREEEAREQFEWWFPLMGVRNVYAVFRIVLIALVTLVNMATFLAGLFCLVVLVHFAVIPMSYRLCSYHPPASHASDTCTARSWTIGKNFLIDAHIFHEVDVVMRTILDTFHKHGVPFDAWCPYVNSLYGEKDASGV